MAAALMAERRRNSIGTLTGWQLLANQVAGSSKEQGPDDDEEAGTSTDARSARQRLLLRSPSSCSSMSDDSGHAAAAAACVTPRPHQWLYKEYKIQDEIGSGGFGRVCRARRLTDGKEVVVKEIKTTSLSAKQKAATMDEVEVLAKLNHPNIVKYHDCFMDDVYINIVMEYCNAGDLAGLVKGRAGRLLPEAEVMCYFVQICLALQYVHSAGVLHRDLKTSNVLITSNAGLGGQPLLKLGDFGVAKINSAESSLASTIVGTPQYLSPEMCDNKPYGKKSDVWALGCVLYELASLAKAFDLGNGGISGIILKIMRGTYAPLPQGYSPDLVALVGRLLQTDPAVRPSVMEILNMPYVRQHLSAYLEWARTVPQAQPQVLLHSLGELGKREASFNMRAPPAQAPQQAQQQQQPQVQQAHLAKTSSSSSVSGAHSPQPSQQLPPLQQQQQHGPLEQQSSDPQALYAASSRVGTPGSKRGSSSGSSLAAPSSASASSADLERQCSATSNNGGAAAAAAAAAAARPPLAPAAVGAHAEQQQLRQSLRLAAPGAGGAPGGGGAPSSPHAAGPPPGSLSGWLGGDTSLSQRMLMQQQVLTAHAAQQQAVAEQQLSQPLAALPLAPQLGMKKQPRMSCPSPGEALVGAHPGMHGGPPPPVGPPLPLEPGHSVCSGLSGDTYQSALSPRADGAGGGASSRASLAQEQLEGLKRLRGLKARLQVPSGDGGGGSGPLRGAARDQAPHLAANLATSMSLDSDSGLHI